MSIALISHLKVQVRARTAPRVSHIPDLLPLGYRLPFAYINFAQMSIQRVVAIGMFYFYQVAVRGIPGGIRVITIPSLYISDSAF